MSVDELTAEVDTAFAMEMARSVAMERCVERYGREATYFIWRLGWCVGQQAGLAKAQRVLSEPSSPATVGGST